MNEKESFKFLESQSAYFGVSSLANVVLEDKRFPIWSGSGHSHQHHYGKHGLIIHTAEVVELCLNNNKLLSAGIDERELYLAGLFHDVGKTWDYEACDSDYKDWRKTPHARHIHHVSRSALVWNQAALEDESFHLSKIDEITHAILAHHGQREWGSPVMPNTKLAWMLHLCDSISARTYDADTWDHVKNV